jgi:hypothetical protein
MPEAPVPDRPNIHSSKTRKSQADSKASDLFSIAVFCGFGLLVSLSVLLLDQYVPGDWF